MKNAKQKCGCGMVVNTLGRDKWGLLHPGAGCKAQRDRALAKLRELDDQADAIRKTMGIHKPGAELFQWECGEIDEDLLVEADGYGGADLLHVEGDGDNRLEHARRHFDTESEAEAAAGELMGEDCDSESHGPGSDKWDEIFAAHKVYRTGNKKK